MESKSWFKKNIEEELIASFIDYWHFLPNNIFIKISISIIIFIIISFILSILGIWLYSFITTHLRNINKTIDPITQEVSDGQQLAIIKNNQHQSLVNKLRKKKASGLPEYQEATALMFENSFKDMPVQKKLELEKEFLTYFNTMVFYYIEKKVEHCLEKIHDTYQNKKLIAEALQNLSDHKYLEIITDNPNEIKILNKYILLVRESFI